MDISQIKSFRRAFIVGDKDLASLLGLIHADSGASLKIYLADGTVYPEASMEQFTQLANSGGKRIVTIDFSMRTSGCRASVELRDWSSDDTIQIYASGDEKEVLWVITRVNEWLTTITPWYHRIATIDFVESLFLSLVVIYVVVVPLAVIVLLTRGLGTLTSPSQDRGGSLLIQLLWFALLAFAGLLNFARSYVFPVAIFDIGGGMRRRKFAERLRTVFGLSFLAAVLSSVLAAWIIQLL